jgi:hypothetical protein
VAGGCLSAAVMRAKALGAAGPSLRFMTLASAIAGQRALTV